MQSISFTSSPLCPYFSSLSSAESYEAGYFEESVKLSSYDLSLMAAPLEFLRSKIRSPKTRLGVLVATGKFAPIHSGHLAMMSAAKARLEATGLYDFVGGYIAPDHDEYVSTKAKDYTIDDRVEAILAAIQTPEFASWLRIDFWPGYFVEGAVNYTRVYERLRLYLEKHLGCLVDLYFVCGGDNARFYKAFERSGRCIIVGRGGCEVAAKIKAGQTRALFADCDDFESSTNVRSQRAKIPFVKKDLLLRVTDGPRELEVAEALKPFYKTVTVIKSSEQKEMFASFETSNVISLDPLIPAKYNLQISRLYDFMGVDKIGWTNRPKTKDLEKQAFRIPWGSYSLFDDDICTGKTVEFAKQFLGAYDIHVTRVFAGVRSEGQEILDARDFLGEGLVIKTSGEWNRPDFEYYESKNEEAARFPYVLPFVIPRIRCSVENSREFSDVMRKFSKTN